MKNLGLLDGVNQTGYVFVGESFIWRTGKGASDKQRVSRGYQGNSRSRTDMIVGGLCGSFGPLSMMCMALAWGLGRDMPSSCYGAMRGEALEKLGSYRWPCTVSKLGTSHHANKCKHSLQRVRRSAGTRVGQVHSIFKRRDTQGARVERWPTDHRICAPHILSSSRLVSRTVSLSRGSTSERVNPKTEGWLPHT